MADSFEPTTEFLATELADRQLAIAEHHNLVGFAYRRQPVRDDDAGAPTGDDVERALREAPREEAVCSVRAGRAGILAVECIVEVAYLS